MPLSRPVLFVNVAQDGLPLMLKTRLLPSGSLAVGSKPYSSPSTTEAGGVPPIVGGLIRVIVLPAPR
jgi:hypothetical protein